MVARLQQRRNNGSLLVSQIFPDGRSGTPFCVSPWNFRAELQPFNQQLPIWTSNLPPCELGDLTRLPEVHVCRFSFFRFPSQSSSCHDITVSSHSLTGRCHQPIVVVVAAASFSFIFLPFLLLLLSGGSSVVCNSRAFLRSPVPFLAGPQLPRLCQPYCHFKRRREGWHF